MYMIMALKAVPVACRYSEIEIVHRKHIIIVIIIIIIYIHST